MPTLTQIFGGLLVLAALALAVHEVWAYNSAEYTGLKVTKRRLRRRLTGVTFILVVVALLTWAGHTGDPILKVSLYLACLPPVLLLFGLAYGDLRETGTQVVKEHLDLDPEEMREIMKDPQLRDLLERAQQGGAE
jgi:Mn2+/Fe2+ NRAMP family transporter